MLLIKVFEVLECGGPGGTGNQVAALCNGLDPKKFEVSLVYSSRDGRPEDYRAAAPCAKKSFYVPEMVREISPKADLKALIKLTLLFRSEKPDVVHAHSSKAGFLARLAAKLAGVKKIYYSPRGYGFLQKDKSLGARALYKFLEWSVSWIGEIVAVSESEARLARPLAWGRPVHVVSDAYLGQGLPESADKEPGQTVLGGCGRMTHARNMEAFVTLCQRVTDSRNGLKCLWIGGGEQQEDVKRHLENMNLLSKVEITGWLDGARAREKMRALDVFVHFSRWDALPNSVLEAMACGLPVVASDVLGNRDAVVHGETGFLAKNEVELLEYCLKLIDNPELRRRLGAAGRARVLKEFPLEKTLSALQSLYEKN